MANETDTEAAVRGHFAADSHAGLDVSEQRSPDQDIKDLLKGASKKTGGTGAGIPDFTIRAPDSPGLVVIVECKYDHRKHVSQNLDRPQDFAVDGALHYASKLSQGFDVIALGVTGTRKDLRVSTHKWRRGENSPDLLRDANGRPVKGLLDFANYKSLCLFDSVERKKAEDELIAFSRELSAGLRDYAKVREAEKPLLVSGVLIALQDHQFVQSWQEMTAKLLPLELYAALKRQIENADLPNPRRDQMLQPYSFLTSYPQLVMPVQHSSESTLQLIVRKMAEHTLRFIQDNHDIDLVARFYGEFLGYSGGDKQSLGIVLTPRHVTELMVKLADIGPRDTVVDTCCGTGGFLIAAMVEMLAKADGNDLLQQDIRERRLVGVEQQSSMYALAAANMLLRSDGTANLYQGSCFDHTDSLVDATKVERNGALVARHDRPNRGLLNPPYSQKGADLHELNFIKHQLDCLEPGGRLVAVVPMSVALGKHPLKTTILANHTLDAVMSMPAEIFYPVGVVSCIMVFIAGRPHANSSRPTWFGYWKDDGFVKTKNLGRIDSRHTWPERMERWVHSYYNRGEVLGQSVSQTVEAGDEWCVEAYMETDYSTLTQRDFEREVKAFVIYCMGLESNPAAKEGVVSEDAL